MHMNECQMSGTIAQRNAVSYEIRGIPVITTVAEKKKLFASPNGLQ